MEGADAAPRFLEGLLEAMLQSFYDRFGGLSKRTKDWTGVYIWQTGVDGCALEPRCLKYHGCHEAWRGLMLRFGLLMCVCLFSWVARFFLLLGPRAHLVLVAVAGCGVDE